MLKIKKKEKEKKMATAKNWMLKEAVKVIVEGTNTEAMQELGKRFPLTSLAIAKMGNNEGANVLLGAMPDYMTMLKMERALKESVGAADDEDQESAEEAEEAIEEVGEEDAGEKDFNAMTKNELYEECVKRGIKAQKHQKPKAYYIELLTAESASDEESEEDEEDQAEAGPDYNEMTAMELYKLCKKRGIKTEPKQKAAVYIKLLKAADASAEESEEDEDWGEDEEAPAPKKTGKATKNASKAKKEEAADEEDDDWDI